MSSIVFPFSPSGALPSTLFAGRAALLEEIDAACRDRAHASAFFVAGLAGCGKTALLTEAGRRAQAASHAVSIVPCEPGGSLLEGLHPAVGKELRAYALRDDLREVCEEGLAVWRDFALTRAASRALRKSAHRSSARDFGRLFAAAGRAARAAESSWIVLIDGVQALFRYECEALLDAFARAAAEKLPVCLVAAGLPRAHGGLFASAASRLPLRCVELNAPAPHEMKAALVEMLAAAGCSAQDDALGALVESSRGEPLLLQATVQSVRKAVGNRRGWSGDDVHAALPAAGRLLAQTRFEPLAASITQAERRYLRAMLELGARQTDARAVAARIGVKPRAAAALRAGLIRRGVIYSPQRAIVAFASPLFAEFLRSAQQPQI